MPEIAYTRKTLVAVGKEAIRIIKWTGLANGDTGQPVQLPHSPDKSVQIYGTFGSGGSVTLEGSNDLLADTPTYGTLHTNDLSTLTFGAAGIACIIENTNLIRPNVTAGDETTELTIIICIK